MHAGWDGLLARFRVDDLKDICRKAGLQVTGTKPLLIQRIKHGLKDASSSRVSKAVKDTHERIEARLNQHVERRQVNKILRRNDIPTFPSVRQNQLMASSCNQHLNMNHHQCNVVISADDPVPVITSNETDESILNRGEKDPFVTILSQVGNIFRLVGGGYNCEVAVSSAVILDATQIENIRNDTTVLALRGFKLKPSTGEGLKWEERGHLWPLDTKVCVNGRKIEIKQRKILWQGTERKIRGSCSLADISKFCLEGVNLLRLSCLDIESYGFVVQIVKKYSVEEVMENIKKQPDSGNGLQRAIDSFKKGNYGGGSVEGSDDDYAVSATSMRLSLKCPLGLTTINVPARGAKCTHLQCFDLEVFLRYCSIGSESTWRCAVCHKPADPHEVVVDQFMMNIVNEVKKNIGSEGEGIDEVDIFDDGRWEPVRTQLQKNPTQSRKRKRSQLLHSSSAISQQPLNCAAASVAAANALTFPSTFTTIPQLNNPGSVPANEVVDLSLDADSPTVTSNPAPICEISNPPILPPNDELPPLPPILDETNLISFGGIDNVDVNMEEYLLEALRFFQNG
eukprot:16892_1